MSDLGNLDYQITFTQANYIDDQDSFYRSIEYQESQNLPEDLRIYYSPPLHVQGTGNSQSFENASLNNINPHPEKDILRDTQIKKKRNDNHNLTQNLSSNIKTKLLKILSPKCKGKKADIELQESYKNYLKVNGASNNGLIILFAYLFMKQRATSLQIELLRQEIIKYLERKIKATQSNSKEGEAYIKKLNIHRRLAERYLDGVNEDIDCDWVKKTASDLFTGRQKDVITKPLNILDKIQRTSVRSSLDSLSQSQLIQSLLENSK